MTLHICKGLLDVPTHKEMIGIYWTALFCRYILGFTVVGQTNFNIEGVAILKGSGTGASINTGTGNEFAVKIPSIQYTVSSSDLNRVLILKSSLFPLQNSGMYRITAINVAQNLVYIEPQVATRHPAETGTLTWVMTESDRLFTFNTNGNAAATGLYHGQGAATCSRIILQSPNAMGWQVRLCSESTTDTATNGLSQCTVAAGFGGDSAGDFPAGGEHLHQNQWRNTNSPLYQMSTAGLDIANGSDLCKTWIWGDDVTGTCVIVIASATAGSVSANLKTWAMFGLPENEELPLPPRDIQRLFSIGVYRPDNTLGTSWRSGASSNGSTHFPQGSAFGLSRQPVSCCFGLYAFLTGQDSSATDPMFVTAASENSFTLETEFLPVDLMSGTYDTFYVFTGVGVYQLEPRRLGRVPLARAGRAITVMSTSEDSMWIHIDAGIWLPWSGEPVMLRV